MARNKKIYFWLKIDKNFYSNLAIKQARRIPGGDTMIIIYQRLMLESLSSHGVLYYEGTLQSLEKELALLLEETEDNIKMTLSYFVNAKLIQLDDEHNAEMLQVPALLMQETDWAKYKRNQREQKKLDNVQQLSNSSPIDIDIEIELEKEINIDIESEVELKQPAPPGFNIYAYYQQRIGVMDGYQVEKLKGYVENDGMELELIKRAIDRGADNSKRNFGYINAILKNWAQDGIKTIVQQDEEQRRFKEKSQKTESNVPDWATEEYRTEATPEELEKLEELRKRMAGEE